MLKNRLFVFSLTMFVLPLVTMSGCIQNRNNIVYGEGTIKFINLEGGFFGIISDGGKKYYPINLNESYHIDGLRVKFEGKIRDDIATTYMWGYVLEIIKIEKI
jgi:hypothetical protein